MTSSHNNKKGFLFWVSLSVCFLVVFTFWFINFKKTFTQAAATPSEFDTASSELKKTSSLFARFSEIGKELAKQKVNLTIPQTQENLNNTDLSQIQWQKVLIEKIENENKTAEAEKNNLPVVADTKGMSTKKVSPAATYCVQNSGKIISRTDLNNKKYQICQFSDKSECEIESFYKAKCQPGQYEKWQSEIDKLPDLVLRVEKSGYCKDMSQPISWLTTREKAGYICFENITITNNGKTKSEKTDLVVAAKSFDVPALIPGEVYQFPKSLYVKIFNNQTVGVITIDSQKLIKEANEGNNQIIYPQ